MNWFDIIVLLPLVFGLARGIMRGLVKEIVAIFGLLISFVCARAFSSDLAPVIQDMLTWETDLSKTVAFLVIFFTVSICLSLLGWLLTKLLHAIHLGWLNRLGGGLVGLFKWAFIISVLINCIDFLDDHFHFLQPDLKENSCAYKPLRKIAAVGLVAWDKAIED